MAATKKRKSPPREKSFGTLKREVEDAPAPPPERSPFKPKNLVRLLWDFTESDFATFIFPDTAFGVFAALSGPLLTQNESPHLLEVLARLPLSMLWNWCNLLIFDLANQRQPDAVLEDRFNKPWRPLPSGRITVHQTRFLLLLSLPCVLAVNYFLGAWQETVILFLLTWMYNDLGGGEMDFMIRNTIIAFAFGQYNKGSMRVAAAQTEFSVPNHVWQWIAMTSAVIGSTMHVQDMKDQEGDKAKGRKSAPLVMGDVPARWSIAIPTAIWSIACPMFWDLGLWGYALPVGLGATIVLRILLMGGFLADKRTWWLWTFWTGVIWALPVFKDHSVFTRFANEYWPLAA